MTISSPTPDAPITSSPERSGEVAAAWEEWHDRGPQKDGESTDDYFNRLMGTGDKDAPEDGSNKGEGALGSPAGSSGVKRSSGQTQTKPFETGSSSRFSKPGGAASAFSSTRGVNARGRGAAAVATSALKNWDNAGFNETLGLTPPSATPANESPTAAATEFHLDLSSLPSSSYHQHSAGALSPETLRALGLESYFTNSDMPAPNEQMEILAKLSALEPSPRITNNLPLATEPLPDPTPARNIMIDPVLVDGFKTSPSSPTSASVTAPPSSVPPAPTSSSDATPASAPAAKATRAVKRKAAELDTNPQNDILVSAGDEALAVPDDAMAQAKSVEGAVPVVSPQPDEGDEDRPHACPSEGCTKSFNRKSDFLRHYRIHSGERPFVCDVEGCTKSFIQRSALTVHARVHSGDRPHACDQCPRAFSDSSSLARHKRIHDGSRPYLCDMCGTKAFSRRATMKRHQNICRGKSGEKRPKRPKKMAMNMDVESLIALDGGSEQRILKDRELDASSAMDVDDEEEEDDQVDESRHPSLSPSLQQLQSPNQPSPPMAESLHKPSQSKSMIDPALTASSTPLSNPSPRRNNRTPRPPTQSLRKAPNTSSTAAELAASANTSDTRTEVHPVPRPGLRSSDSMEGEQEGTAEEAAILALVSGLRD